MKKKKEKEIEGVKRRGEEDIDYQAVTKTTCSGH